MYVLGVRTYVRTQPNHQRPQHSCLHAAVLPLFAGLPCKHTIRANNLSFVAEDIPLRFTKAYRDDPAARWQHAATLGVGLTHSGLHAQHGHPHQCPHRQHLPWNLGRPADEHAAPAASARASSGEEDNDEFHGAFPDDDPEPAPAREQLVQAARAFVSAETLGAALAGGENEHAAVAQNHADSMAHDLAERPSLDSQILAAINRIQDSTQLMAKFASVLRKGWAGHGRPLAPTNVHERKNMIAFATSAAINASYTLRVRKLLALVMCFNDQLDHFAHTSTKSKQRHSLNVLPHGKKGKVGPHSNP